MQRCNTFWWWYSGNWWITLVFLVQKTWASCGFSKNFDWLDLYWNPKQSRDTPIRHSLEFSPLKFWWHDFNDTTENLSACTIIPQRYSFRWCLKYLWLYLVTVPRGRLTWNQERTLAIVSLYQCRFQYQFQYQFLLSYLGFPNDNPSCSLTQTGELSELNLHHVLGCNSSILLHLHLYQQILKCRRYLIIPQYLILPRFINFTSLNYFEARYPRFQNYIYIS